VSGVVHTSPSETIVDQVMTSSRCAELACAAATPPAMPTSPATTAPQPTRRSPRVIAPTPRNPASDPTTIGAATFRTVSGGRANQNATAPATMPAMPIARAVTSFVVTYGL